MKSREEQQLRAKAKETRARLEALDADLRVVDAELEGLAPQRTQHELLEKACGSLERLGELGAGSLFWGDRIEPVQAAERLREVRGRVDAFRAQIGVLDERRLGILDQVAREEKILEILGEDLYDLRQAEERRKQEWLVEREISATPHEVRLMAWSRGGEDDRRFRKTLAVSLLASLLIALMLPMVELPLPTRFVPEEAPERLVQFLRQEQAKMIPPPPVVAEKPPEPEEQEPAEETKPKEQKEPVETAKAAPDQESPVGPSQPLPPGEPGQAGPPVQEKQVAKAGILAFRDEFASLAKDKAAPRLGADARFSDGDDASRNQMPSRSMLTTNAPGSSGGINIGSLSRNLGGGGGGGGDGKGGGGGIQGVPVGRATSSIAGIGPGGRPMAHDGPGPSRTDEEIQIVFDRYKARFYRLYNRELRKDPTLQGQMVLRLTIEPDGSVSMCKVQSSDMNAPDLASQVVEVVLTISFGAKEGVQALTIVYPIDFLPATT